MNELTSAELEPPLKQMCSSSQTEIFDFVKIIYAGGKSNNYVLL